VIRYQLRNRLASDHTIALENFDEKKMEKTQIDSTKCLSFTATPYTANTFNLCFLFVTSMLAAAQKVGLKTLFSG